MPTIQRNFDSTFFYHVYNRGVDGRTTFKNGRDYERFLEATAYYLYNQPIPYTQFLDTKLEVRPKLPKWSDRRVTIFSYCFMPNHFHFLIKQEKKSGISRFLSDLCNSYTKYFNIKNQRTGNLFQGTFKAKEINSEESLLQVSRYIHLNPVISSRVGWQDDPRLYPYSSYKAFADRTNNSLIRIDEVKKFFNLKQYKDFIESKISNLEIQDIESFLSNKRRSVRFR